MEMLQMKLVLDPCQNEGTVIQDTVQFGNLVKIVWGARVIRGDPSQAAERNTDSSTSSGEPSADRTPPLPTAVFDSA